MLTKANSKKKVMMLTVQQQFMKQRKPLKTFRQVVNPLMRILTGSCLGFNCSASGRGAFLPVGT
jgi:hypothetical protein